MRLHLLLLLCSLLVFLGPPVLLFQKCFLFRSPFGLDNNLDLNRLEAEVCSSLLLGLVDIVLALVGVELVGVVLVFDLASLKVAFVEFVFGALVEILHFLFLLGLGCYLFLRGISLRFAIRTLFDYRIFPLVAFA